MLLTHFLHTPTTTKGIITTMTPTTTQRTTLFIRPTILKQAKAQAVVEDSTLTKLVEKALIKYLPKQTVIKKPEL